MAQVDEVTGCVHRISAYEPETGITEYQFLKGACRRQPPATTSTRCVTNLSLSTGRSLEGRCPASPPPEEVNDRTEE